MLKKSLFAILSAFVLAAAIGCQSDPPAPEGGVKSQGVTPPGVKAPASGGGGGVTQTPL